MHDLLSSMRKGKCTGKHVCKKPAPVQKRLPEMGIAAGVGWDDWGQDCILMSNSTFGIVPYFVLATA